MFHSTHLPVILKKIDAMFQLYISKHRHTDQQLVIDLWKAREIFDHLVANIKEYEEALFLGDSTTYEKTINDSIVWFLSSNIQSSSQTNLALILSTLAETSLITFPGMLGVASMIWPANEKDLIAHNNVVIDFFEKQLESYRQDIWHRNGIHVFQFMTFNKEVRPQFHEPKSSPMQFYDNQALVNEEAVNNSDYKQNNQEGMFIDPNCTNALVLLRQAKKRKLM